MNRFFKICSAMVAAPLVFANSASAAETTAVVAESVATVSNFGPTIGAGMIIIGAGLGIGKIGAAAMEGMSRQPEAAGDIRGGMILAAALIEGVTLLALIVCFAR